MNVAFHFNADAEEYGYSYGDPILQKFFRAMLESGVQDVHVKILIGDLLLQRLPRNLGDREEVAIRLLGLESPGWRSLNPIEFVRTVASHNVFVIAVEGLGRSLRDYLHQRFLSDDTYLGAIQINPANPLHWTLYIQYLPPRFRYLDQELRLFYVMGEVDNTDEETVRHWRAFGFSRVSWEDLGARYTVFDEYTSYEHAKRVAELNDVLIDQFMLLVDEVLLRLGDLNPNLQNSLYSALKVLGQAETTEDLAHVSLSCRRFLGGLANALFPPQDQPRKGRMVGREQYRNRLWAYIDDKVDGREAELLEAQLSDLGSRVDKVDALANKGLHADLDRQSVRRLLVALVTVTHDLLTLNAPPTALPLDPFSDAIRAFANKIVEPHNVDCVKDDESTGQK